jgi:hypothetical protein
MVWLSRVDTNIHAAFRVERYAIQDDPQETEDLALALAPASWAKLGSTLAPPLLGLKQAVLIFWTFSLFH